MTTPLSRRLRRLGRTCVVALAGIAGLLGLPGCQLPKTAVAVNALVEPSYIRPADTAGRPLSQSYAFVPGRHFAGMMKYSVLDKVKFTDLLPPLAAGLRQQNYVLATDPNKADLLIVVHWGVVDVLGDSYPMQRQYDEMNDRLTDFATSIRESMANDGNALGDSGPAFTGDQAKTAGMAMADPGGVNETFRDLRTDAFARDVNMTQVAGLLGYTRTLAQASTKPFSTAEEDSLRADLQESRYLVILAAYERAPANGKRRRMWVTRMSMRAPGRNFVEALPAMVDTGRQVFGRETDGILRVQPGLSVPRVRLGELNVIETVSESDVRQGEADRAASATEQPATPPAVQTQ